MKRRALCIYISYKWQTYVYRIHSYKQIYAKCKIQCIERSVCVCIHCTRGNVTTQRVSVLNVYVLVSVRRFNSIGFKSTKQQR